MNLLFVRILLSIILLPAFTAAQEIPAPLIPTERVTYGNNEHTSRDAIFFSEKDNRGNLIVAGYTERDFSFSDVKIISLNENLEENWSDRLSWDGISYDYPMDLLIDKEDHIWVVSKNYYGGTEANFVIVRYSPSGEKLWEYKSPETVENSTLNMNQYYYFFDDEGYLNFNYQKSQESYSSPSFFKISPNGIPSEEYHVDVPLSKLSHTNDQYQGFSLQYDGTETLFFTRFNEFGFEEKILDLSEHQVNRIKNSLFEETTQSFTDGEGNYIYIGDGNFHDDLGSLHPGLFIFSISPTDEINFFLDDDGSTDKYLLDVRINDNNEILILSNTQPITEDKNEPFLTLEKFSKNGELLSITRVESITGNIGKIDSNEILVRTLSGSLQSYDLDLNLLQTYQESPTEVYFNPQDLHAINGNTFLVGTTISAKYEGSDYNSEEDFYIRKFSDKALSAEFSFNGEGTSKYYNYEMIRDASGDFLVSCREFYGPNNLNLGGSKAPYSKKVIRFNPGLIYQDEEVVDEDFDLWEEPAFSFEAENGDVYRYEIGEERKTVSFYLNDEHSWTRTLNFGNDSYMEINYTNTVDKEGNFIVSSSRFGNYNGKIHKLTPTNEYSYIDTGESVMNSVILSNNWIFSILKDYSVRIYSPRLKLISERQYDENYFFGEHYPTLIEKNNKVLLNVRHKKLVMIFDQFGDYEDRFSLEGLLHPSVALFDENDALNVYHVVGKGLYTEHGHNWSRLAISRYANIVEDYIGPLPDADLDGDGVSDFMDQCPDTPQGTPVNEHGCEAVQLPPDNFKLSTRNETCPGKNNGQLKVDVTEEHNYIIDLNGEEHEFRLGMSFEALSPGFYTACIQVEDESQTRQCFEFEIKGGQTFKAQNRIRKNTMQVSVKEGTGPYLVKINGQDSGVYRENNFDIPVKDGDILEVSSSSACEGKINMLVTIGSVSLSSNPVNEVAKVILPNTPYEFVPVRIFNSSSQLIFSGNLKPDNEQNLTIDTSAMPAGIYYLQVQLEKQHALKFIKR
ncbi:MAG: T9SS type A sorting domain-containing protein [Salegentibacter sp.]|uniref:T9SS type A sorting domain-containing protein n=1 Tax=Salegentibacter sp. TaxID=1903072 RepID=UPI002870AAC1|nr:T9SS type A sorting domain-containing protein [Salegentibacter sp.]MDR9458252.1 T9SS type A sorting domain-containing protein [Salegentibacter sp.]